MAYICKPCGTSSDVSKFYKGMTSRCVECHKRLVRENREANVEYYRAYDAKRFQEDPSRRESADKYAATEAGKAAANKAKKKWENDNKEKRAAHIILNNRIRDGHVNKPELCEGCGNSGVRIHGHHHDYSKPLEVKWLCSQCHTIEHGRSPKTKPEHY